MSFVTYSQVVEGLHARFLTIADFPKYNDDGALVNLFDYEPESIQETPAIYTLLDRYERSVSGQITTMRYHIMHRVCFSWQDPREAERLLSLWVHLLPASIEASPQLGGLIDQGLAYIDRAESGFTLISGTKYRILDCYSNVPTKAPVRSGI